MKTAYLTWALGTGLAAMATTTIASPIPIGTSMTTVTYTTDQEVVSFTGSRDFNGQVPTNATVLGAAPNIKTFNSANGFGRRTALANNVNFAHVIGPNETLIAHPFFKSDNGADYFPGIREDSDITVNVGPIRFSEPVSVVSSTFLMHTLWVDDQADMLPHRYHHLHNQHTQTNPFRDLSDFVHGDVFADFPKPDFVLGDITPTFNGNGTDLLTMSVTFPYDMLRSIEETGHIAPPPGLPAPHGFLEPFHFHFEYVVVPEPATLLLLSFGGWVLWKRAPRHKTTHG
ncbi:MAG: PEP-CTERM sorting domain-containing protein [Planctomycetota bacterium]